MVANSFDYRHHCHQCFIVRLCVRAFQFTFSLSAHRAIFKKKVYNAYGTEYAFFRYQLSNLSWNVWTSVVVVFKLCFRRTDLKPLKWYLYVLLASLDTVGGFLATVSGSNTSGAAQTLIGQLSVPLVVGLSLWLLKASYTVPQYMAVLWILAGVCFGILPPPGMPTMENANVWWAVLLYVASQVPGAFSYVLKELYLKANDVDVFQLTAGVSWIQLAMAWALVPLLSIDAFGGIKLSSIPSVMSNGFRCFLGDTSVPVINDGVVVGHCSRSVTLVSCALLLSDLVSGIMMLFIMKKMSSSLMVVAVAVALPLSNIAFSVPFLMGDQVLPFNLFDALGLALVTIGFVVFSWFERRHAAPVGDSTTAPPDETKPLLLSVQTDTPTQ